MLIVHMFLSHGAANHRYLHSFPTRRSSDLVRGMLRHLRGPHISEERRPPERRIERRNLPRNSRAVGADDDAIRDRKSTRLNSSHRTISYAVFCLKKKKNHVRPTISYYRPTQ